MTPLKSLFGKLFSSDRRKSERQPAPKLDAYYWTGGAPAAHGIRDISLTGLYLVTEERWYPGTLITMTLQKNDNTDEDSVSSIAVKSKAVRWGDDGVGLEFVLPESQDKRKGQNSQEAGADRKTLEKFLKGFNSENGHVIINYIALPSEIPC
jgi:hypothetical protein